MSLAKTSLCLNKKTLIGASAGAILIILGVLAIERQTEAKNTFMSSSGVPIFMIGWFTFLYFASTASSSSNKVWIVLSGIGVMAFAMMGQKGHVDKSNLAIIGGIGFAASWLSLAFSISYTPSGLDKEKSAMAVTGAIAIITAMNYLLVKQRKTKNVYGEGMPLFTIGWALMVAAVAKE